MKCWQVALGTERWQATFVSYIDPLSRKWLSSCFLTINFPGQSPQSLSISFSKAQQTHRYPNTAPISIQIPQQLPKAADKVSMLGISCTLTAGVRRVTCSLSDRNSSRSGPSCGSVLRNLRMTASKFVALSSYIVLMIHWTHTLINRTCERVPSKTWFPLSVSALKLPYVWCCLAWFQVSHCLSKHLHPFFCNLSHTAVLLYVLLELLTEVDTEILCAHCFLLAEEIQLADFFCVVTRTQPLLAVHALEHHRGFA